MIAELQAQVLVALQTLFDRFGWFGVACLSAFESATSLTPSELFLGLAGWMLLAAHGAHPVMILVGGLWAALGSAAGASFTYWVARLGGRPLVERIMRRLHIPLFYLQVVEGQFHRWGAGLVMAGRLVPAVRFLISIPAGLARMPFPRYFLYTFIGAYVWCTVLIGAGYAIGHEWALLRERTGDLAPIMLVALAGLLALSVLARRWIQRRAAALWQPSHRGE